MTSLGEGVASNVLARGTAMFLVTGPVTSTASAWRGEATRRTPKRSASYTGPNVETTSSSQPLHDPASTWRIWSEPSKGAVLARDRESMGALLATGSVTRPVARIL